MFEFLGNTFFYFDLCRALMIEQGKLEMGSKSAEDFTAAMVSQKKVNYKQLFFQHNVITSEAWMNSETDEISEEVFVKFWKNFYKLFYTLDRNKGIIQFDF